MAQDQYGQMISFATEVDPDNPHNYTRLIWERVTRTHRTIRSIAYKHGHPEMARTIAHLNNVRDVKQKLRVGRALKLPGILASPLTVDVHPQDNKRPILKDGYAMFSTVNRYGEKGLTHFTGYNPLAMDVFIYFEGWGIPNTGGIIEAKIKALERMAGRGPGFVGAASGPPAIVRVTTSDNSGHIVPLVPYSFQWAEHGGSPHLLWRFNGIDWDDGALSDNQGRRVRATGTIHLVEHTPIKLSSTAAARMRKKVKPKHGTGALFIPDPGSARVKSHATFGESSFV